MALSDLTDPAAVRTALEEFRELGRSAFLRKYGFGPARHCWLVDGLERFDSKAIVGAAHGAQHPEQGALKPADFSGGEATVANKLRELGFEVESAAGHAQPRFEVGRHDKRRALHERWGGQYQSGIATPAGRPYLLVFTGGGEGYGYSDGWSGDGAFRYFGEGQLGDMRFDGGNRALRDHAADGKAVHLFESKRNAVEYLGEFSCSSYEWATAPEREKRVRRAIVFHLVPLDAEAERHEREGQPNDEVPVDELRRRAMAAAAGAPGVKAGEGRRTYYARSEAVKAYVLARAVGRCEQCELGAPFERCDGSPYLEPHSS
ncbi:MAG: hypothetical protein QM778_00630 [Myxococcales bacterium]